MTFHVVLVEVDQTVGNHDARAVRQYPLASTDTLSYAATLASEHESRLTGERRLRLDGSRHEYVTLVADLRHPHEYGNVYRTTYVLVTSSPTWVRDAVATR